MHLPNMLRRRGLAALAAVALAAMVLAAVLLAPGAAPSAATGGVVDAARERSTLRVGMSTFVPWAMRDKRGRLIGFEIDVARKLARDMGVRAEFVPTPWDGIIPALQSGAFDIVISGMSITPERAQVVDFTAPYAETGKQMAASRRLAGGYDGIADFNKPHVTIACRRGATPCDAIARLFPLAVIGYYDSDAAAFEAVADGHAHAMVSSAPLPLFWAEDDPDDVYIAFGGGYLDRGAQGFALRKGDSESLEFLNGWIAANTASGWLGERHDFWFRNRPAWRDRVRLDQ